MSIRAGILAVLTASEAYGLQLHSELEERTDRAGRINVGQIYSTLDRLCTAGLVEVSGSTDDGLPLYGLSPAGVSEAEEWLAFPEAGSLTPWTDMTFKLLLATSLRGDGAMPLVQRYRDTWLTEAASADEGEGEGVDAATRAQARLAVAALGWLDDLESLPGGLAALARPLRNERPRRGRRPSA
ncbi:PadR family transcriptional regulator [Herbiconiux solani]|uniref:PadR family transcriptional regulator n=1 Tax=Herbiconiux solani TaxID=661329 RepID=UPI0008260BB7|nr:PadR family transcriptional regulator [Herbiconiux solani]